MRSFCKVVRQSRKATESIGQYESKAADNVFSIEQWYLTGGTPFQGGINKFRWGSKPYALYKVESV